MSSFQGMDPQQVRNIAGRLTTHVAGIEAVINTVNNAIHEAKTEWEGKDAHDFEGWWTSQHRPRLLEAHSNIQSMVQALLRNAEEQERASGGGSTHAGGAGSLRSGSVNPAEIALFATLMTKTGLSALAFGNDLVDASTGGTDLFKMFGKSPLFSAALKGVGVGDGLAEMAIGLRDGDWGRFVTGSIDTGTSAFAKSPVGLLWTGLKTEVGFFLPLNREEADNHYAWMEKRGYSGADISNRYSGVNGFIQYGNDNVERHAPWMNDIADKVTQKPAEWLYNAGIRL